MEGDHLDLDGRGWMIKASILDDSGTHMKSAWRYRLAAIRKLEEMPVMYYSPSLGGTARPIFGPLHGQSCPSQRQCERIT